MKRIIKNTLTLLLIALSYASFAQNNNRIIAVQGGTGHLKQGTSSIILDEPMPVNTYFVSITPLGETKGLYVTKSGNSIVVKAKAVKGKPVADIDFDYIIYRNIPLQPATTAFKPKMAPGGVPATK